MSRTDPQFKLRLPIELKERIEEKAKKNKRSINAELVDCLEKHYEASSDEVLPLSSPLTTMDVIRRIGKLAGLSDNPMDNKVKVKKISDKTTRVIQGLAVGYLDLDFSLPFDQLKPMLKLAMSALIESNPKFKKWQKKVWDIYEGGHHLCFIEVNVGDPNILIVTDFDFYGLDEY